MDAVFSYDSEGTEPRNPLPPVPEWNNPDRARWHYERNEGRRYNNHPPAEERTYSEERVLREEYRRRKEGTWSKEMPPNEEGSRMAYSYTDEHAVTAPCQCLSGREQWNGCRACKRNNG